MDTQAQAHKSNDLGSFLINMQKMIRGEERSYERDGIKGIYVPMSVDQENARYYASKRSNTVILDLLHGLDWSDGIEKVLGKIDLGSGLGIPTNDPHPLKNGRQK